MQTESLSGKPPVSTSTNMVDREAGVTIGDNRLVVTVSGKMLVTRSAAFCRELLDALERSSWVEVDCSALTDADLTFFQLLCSAHHTVTRRNKKITITGQDTAMFGALAAAIGLERHVGCDRDVCQSCLWTGGREL